MFMIIIIIIINNNNNINVNSTWTSAKSEMKKKVPFSLTFSLSLSLSLFFSFSISQINHDPKGTIFSSYQSLCIAFKFEAEEADKADTLIKAKKYTVCQTLRCWLSIYYA